MLGLIHKSVFSRWTDIVVRIYHTVRKLSKVKQKLLNFEALEVKQTNLIKFVNVMILWRQECICNCEIVSDILWSQNAE